MHCCIRKDKLKDTFVVTNTPTPISVVSQQKGFASVYLNLTTVEFVGPNTLDMAFYIEVTEDSLVHLHNMKRLVYFLNY